MRGLLFTANAKEDLAKLDRTTARQVFNKLRWLAENFDSLSPEPLSGDLKTFFKLRIGDYRALYSQNNHNILVHFIRHRREVYKRK